MARRTLPVLLLLAVAGACHKQEAAAPQPVPAAAAPQQAPLAVVTTSKGKAAPTIAFDDLAGGQTDLARFKGKPVLVNLWATWCVPCVKELPTLDALAKREDGRLQVVAISEDMEGAKVVPPFLAAHGVTTLHPYHDASNALMTALQEASLPVSILYDADGREVWRVPGDLDWTGAKAKELLAQGGV